MANAVNYYAMTSGILFAMACPMLEDELVYMLKEDSERKNVIVLETPYNDSIRRKLDEKDIGYALMSEDAFMSGKSGLDRSEYNVVIRMKDLGLHIEPTNLKANLENDLRDLEGKVDAVALYYGMCGNFGWDPSKWAEENLDYPVRIFKDTKGRVIDDCVGVAVGGIDGYRELQRRNRGSMLFTPEIATNWTDFMSASDTAYYGEGRSLEQSKQDLKDMMEQCGYHAVVQIDTGYEDDRTDFDKCTRDFADYNGFEIRQCDPDLIDRGPAIRLYTEAKALLG